MFITIVTKCYYTFELYYICDQLLHLCLQQQSLSFLCTPTMRKAFAMSPTRTTLFSRNRNEMSNNNGFNDGPTCKQSFKEVPVLVAFDDALYTILTFVVVASFLTTA